MEKIELLRAKVDQVKTDCDQWKARMDRLAAEKEAALAKLSSAEALLQNLREKSSAQAKRVEELEAGLAEANAKIEKTNVMADKSIAMYRADVEAVQTQLREASDRKQWRSALAKCQSWRETLEEIHARGVDLFEEIARAKELETEARQLIFLMMMIMMAMTGPVAEKMVVRSMKKMPPKKTLGRKPVSKGLAPNITRS